MKTLFTLYMPHPEVEFTHGEAILLFCAAASHYDGKCKQAAQQGGVLFGLLNTLGVNPEEVRLFTLDDCLAELSNTRTESLRLSMDDLSILCKIAESPLLLKFRDLKVDLTELLKTLNAEISEQLLQKP